MTTSLTNRYIAATVRSLPEGTQADVRAELAASIADDIDARVEQGQSPAEAEHEVLTRLGDPDALAASYADRPLHLIGPKYYLTWLRLMKTLLWIVPAFATLGVTIAKIITDAPVPDIVGSAFSVLIGSIVHVVFWTTLVFVIIERTGTDTGVTWTVDALPEEPETGAGRGELVSSLVFLGFAAMLILWDRFVGLSFWAQGSVNISEGLGSQANAISILHPELWPWWTGTLLLIIGLEAALAVAVYARHGWTRTLATLNTLIAVIVTAGAIYLLALGKLVNPDFTDMIFGNPDNAENLMRITATTLGAAIVAVSAWDVFEGWRKALRRR